MVGASFGLQSFTQTRYDLHSQKVTQVRVALRLILPPCSDLFPYKRGPPLTSAWLAGTADHYHNAQTIFQMSREQELGLDRSRKKFDVREEYFVSFHLFL